MPLTPSLRLAPPAALIAGLGVLLCACAGDDEEESPGDGSGFSSGLATSRQASTLSVDEARAFCQSLSTELGRVFSPGRLTAAVCEASAAFLTSTVGECDQMAQTCIAEDAAAADTTGLLDTADVDCADAHSDLSACDATVGQLEVCFNDTIEELAAVFDSYACENAASLEIANAPDTDSVPTASSCAALESGCALVEAATAAFSPHGALR